ncbi:MAG: hypothetical protein HRU75_09130 [Planctomycetia bacterium]|nr:MAG: hypothetical protein HRU75_09130 [Planctomycetia bacterium]
MIVTVDGRNITGPVEPGASLGTLIDCLRAERPGVLITRVAVNGTALCERTADAALAQALADEDCVEVETGSPGRVVSDALREVAATLGDAGRASPEAAQRLNSGEVAAAMQDIADLVGIWQSGRTAVSQAGALLQRDLADLELDGVCVGEHLNALIARLTEIRDAMIARDHVLLADLLHYEMPELCETWERVLNGIADTVAGCDDAGDSANSGVGSRCGA